MARSRLIAGKRSSSCINSIDTGALSHCIDQLMNISSITPSTVSLSQDNFDLIRPAAAAVSSAHAAISTNEADTPDHCGFSLGDDTISIDHGFERAPSTIRKRFVGVRQRPSGRWVAEIKDTLRKIRLWLGTFNTAEEAAHAYDEAACLLRGTNTRTNFMPSPDRIANYGSSKASRLLHLRLNHSTAGNNTRKQLPNTAAHSIDVSSSAPPHPSSNLTSHYSTETCLSPVPAVSDHTADQIPRINELKSDHYAVNLRDYEPISATNDHEINDWDHKLMKSKDNGNNNGYADYRLKSGHNGIESSDYELDSKAYVHKFKGYRPSSSFPDPNVQVKEEIHHEAVVPKGDEIIQDYTVNRIQLIPYLPMFNRGQVDFNVNNEQQIIKNTVSSDLQNAFSSLDHEEMFYPSLFELAQEVAAVPLAATYHHLDPSDHDYQKAVHSYERLISPKFRCQAHDHQNQQHPQDSCDHSEIDEELDLKNGKKIKSDGGLEESMKTQETSRRMNYERQGSASLYTMNGVTECLLLSYTSGRHFSMSSPSLELPASFHSQCNTNWSSQKAPPYNADWASHQIVSSQHRSNQEELEDDDEVNLASSSSCSPQHSEIDHGLTTSCMATNHDLTNANQHDLISFMDRAVLPPVNNPSSTNIMLDRQRLPIKQSKISPARVEHSLDQCSAIPEALWNSWNLSPLCT